MGKDSSKNKNGSAYFWIVGTVITSALPYLVMVVGWVGENFTKSFWYYYTGIPDTIAFTYSVIICYFILCAEDNTRLDTQKRTQNMTGSALLAMIYVAIYCVRVIYGLNNNSEQTVGMSNVILIVISLSVSVMFIIKGFIILRVQEDEKPDVEGELISE